MLGVGNSVNRRAYELNRSRQTPNAFLDIYTMKQTVSPYLHPESSLYPLPQQLRTALPGLTIVIATFNQARVLPRAVRPALMAAKNLRSQNIPANVLVIDNASRDGSMTLLRQLEAVYFEAGLRVLSLPQTFKPVVVHNKALVQASYRTPAHGRWRC